MISGRDSKNRRRVKEQWAEIYWQSLLPAEEETPEPPEDDEKGWDVIDSILSDIEERIMTYRSDSMSKDDQTHPSCRSSS